MKSSRKAKAAADINQFKATSSQSVRSLEEMIPPNAEDWQPPKSLLKPTGQVQLQEKELNEDITRILNANNPHAPQNISRYNHKEMIFKTVANMEHISYHFEYDG